MRKFSLLLFTLGSFFIPFVASAAYPFNGFVVSRGFEASNVYIDSATSTKFFAYANNVDYVGGAYAQIWMDPDGGTGNVCGPVDGPITYGSESNDLSVTHDFGADSPATTNISHIYILMSDSDSVDTNGCLDSGTRNFYQIWSNDSPDGFKINVGLPGSSGIATSTASTTPEQTTAATELGALGLFSFISGLTVTLWMWTRFLG